MHVTSLHWHKQAKSYANYFLQNSVSCNHMLIKAASICFVDNTRPLSQMTNKLRTAQRAMERKMLDLRLQDKIPCSEIRKRTKVIDIIEYTLKQKWKWAGHIARMKDNRWTKRKPNHRSVSFDWLGNACHGTKVGFSSCRH